MSETTLAQRLRPPGPISSGCRTCPIFDRCGGIQHSIPLMNCFDLFCCGDESCDNVCLHKPDFQQRLLEVGGLRFDDLPPLHQEEMSLPRYVPVIHHPYRRQKRLNVNFAALNTYDIFRLKGDEYRAVATTPEEIRRFFRISESATIILRGTAEDADLERYWSHRKTSQVVDQIKNLGVSLTIGPNFSSFLDVPRTDLLFNRRRQLLCLSELSEAGVSVAPHLSATMPADWSFWKGFLRSQHRIQHVALNCQTGYKSPREGRKAINQIIEIQSAIKRPLSLILIGGAQFAHLAAKHFESFTVLDSSAFFRTVYRHQMSGSSPLKRKFQETWTLEGQPLDDLLQQNVDAHIAWHTDTANGGRP